jgi:predicted RNA binding protein YcfA (HicA-like mRNA interferase family)
MKIFPEHIWNELKGTLLVDLVRALEKDGFREDTHEGAERIYIKKGPVTLRVSIPWSNPEQVCGSRLLKAILEDTEWSLDDLRRLKLLK